MTANFFILVLLRVENGVYAEVLAHQGAVKWKTHRQGRSPLEGSSLEVVSSFGVRSGFFMASGAAISPQSSMNHDQSMATPVSC
jgi:hypothetical protein